jgi:uncharacterized membrane protein SpoIIM required for sporulation
LSSRPLGDRRAELARFEALLDASERLRLAQLPFDELRELGRLYRRHAAELARTRDRDEDPDAIRHLNALCVRAYTQLYPTPPPEQPREAGFAARLPLAIARTWRPQLLAWALLALGLLLGAALEARDPDAVYALVPRSLGYSTRQLDRLVSSPEARAEFLARDETPVLANALFGSFLFAHNTRVGVLSFATGMLAGIPTVLLQVYNGLLVGALGAVFLQDPQPWAFLAWILPHGIPEFTAVTLCAAAGLLLGGAVALPGRRRRRDALREAVEPALLLLAGAIPLFVAAALVESFVRESALANGTRLAVAAAMLTLLLAALVWVRRVATRVEVDTSWLFELSAPRRSESPGSDSRAPA